MKRVDKKQKKKQGYEISAEACIRSMILRIRQRLRSARL